MQTKTPLQKLIYCAFFAALTAAGAFIKFPIPLSPVPITLQTLFVLLSGAVLGSGYGSLSQIVYILMGMVGLPVFAGFASGPFVLAGPTGGYLIGFVICSFFVGAILDCPQSRDIKCQAPQNSQNPAGFHDFCAARHLLGQSKQRGRFWFYFCVFIIGSIIIYIFGAAGLMIFMRFSFAKAVIAGVAPFIIGDILKITAASYLAVRLKEHKI